MTDKEKLDAIRAEIHRLVDVRGYDREMANDLFTFMDSLPNEPVSIDFEQELYKAFGQVKDFTLGMQIAKWFYDMGRKYHEPVSEDLGEYINELSKQFPEVSFAKLSRIAVRVSRWQRNQDVKNKLPKVINRTELDEYAYQCAYDMSNDWAIENPTWHDVEDACKLGAKWQKEKEYTCYEEAFEDGAAWKVENLWKPADGDDLPEIDREVIVLVKYSTQRNIHDEEYPTYRVGFGHRPNPDGWDGKNIDTNEVTHYTPKLHDRGGWNAPDITYWLDVELPKEIEL